MSRNNRNGNNRDNEEEGGSSGWWWGAAGLAAAAAGLYLLTRGSNKEEEAPSSRSNRSTAAIGYSTSRKYSSSSSSSSENSPRSQPANFYYGMMDNLQSMMDRHNLNGGVEPQGSGRRGVSDASIPDNPDIRNLNALLSDIYLRYIALNDRDFETYYGVVHNIFHQIHNKMKEVDLYYQKYSSTVRFAGSHPDRLRINKPDEFDIDIVIGLPLCINRNPLNPSDSDILLEPRDPGYVQLKMGVQFQQLPFRDPSEWHINQKAYKWKDDKNYLLRSEFQDWFKGVVNRALDQFTVTRGGAPVFYVEGVAYTVRRSEGGPAMTIYVENKARNFKLDVDLVPALRFPIARWSEMPGSYRYVPPECLANSNDYWMVVPKLNKGGNTEHDKVRSWRIAMHEQERMLLHDTNNMRQAIRLIKKFRDSQRMNAIASYYIKTLFFWEAMKHLDDRSFWNNNPAFLFKLMLKNLYEALVKGNIPYFWNKNNNLIGLVDKGTITGYASKVRQLLNVLEDPSQYRQVAKFLLTAEEFAEYSQILARL